MSRPQRVLVKVANWLGDLVMIHPALRALGRELGSRPGGASLSVLVPEGLAGFYRATPWIEEVVVHPWPASWRLPRHLAAAASIRRHAPDTILLLPDSFETALWPWLARVPRRVGMAGEGRSPLLTERPMASGWSRSWHFSEVWRARLSALAGIELANEPAPPDVDPEAARRVATWLDDRRRHPDRSLVAMAPASAMRHKCWPPGRWGELADALADRGAEPLLVVAPWERGLVETVASRMRHAPLVSDAFDVAELIALAGRVDGWIGNDSGPSHVAAALGTPTLTIFVSSNPRRSAPRGSIARSVGPAAERTGPTVEEVLAAWVALA